MSEKIAPKDLVREAEQADKLFRDSWVGMKLNRREFGRACCWIEEKELHRYIRKDGSRKGYLSFDEYVGIVTGGECSRTTIFDCKRIYKLTQGENAIAPEMVDAMPRKNQLRLSQIPPKKRTPKVVEKARKLPVQKFAVVAQSILNDELPPEKQRAPMEDVRLRIHATAAAELKSTMDDFKLLPVVKDGDRALDLESKAIFAICQAARSWASEHIKAAKEKIDRENPEIPEAADVAPVENFSAQDAGEAIGQAELEHRVVRRPSELTH